MKTNKILSVVLIILLMFTLVGTVNAAETKNYTVTFGQVKNGQVDVTVKFNNDLPTDFDQKGWNKKDSKTITKTFKQGAYEVFSMNGKTEWVDIAVPFELEVGKKINCLTELTDYKSSDSSVLKIQNGEIIAVSEGKATITAKTTGSHVSVLEFEGNVKKEYRKDGLYITDISVGNTLIEFELSAKSGETSYVAQKKDTIMNNKKAAANTVKIELSASRTGVRVKLVFNTTKQTDSPLTMYAKVSSSDRKDIVLDTQIPQETAYYVYGQGGLDGIYTDPAKAVLRADTLGGVVLNRTQQYVWERGNKKTKMQIDTEGIPESVLQGTYDIKTLKKSLKKTGTVIDLSGCSLDSVLYEISAQRPVIAKTGADTSVVIVGYDEYNTWLYDPVKKETYPYGMNDSTDLFQKAGNVFITYIETVNY
jgi:hypothetical protein